MTTIFAACDIPYFFEHGVSFAKSIANSGNKGLVVVFPNLMADAGEQIASLLAKLQEDNAYLEHVQVQCMQMVDYARIHDSFQIEEDRAFYASMRFILLRDLVETGPILTLDVDSIIRQKIEIPDCDLGVFLREDNNVGANSWEKQGMKVAAGILYTTPACKPFIDDVVHDLYLQPLRWFVDQKALYNAYHKNKDLLRVYNFNNEILDWDVEKGINEKSPIITAKGNRKTHPNYLELKAKFL